MFDREARRGKARISAGILATIGLRNSWIARDNRERGSLRWFRPVYRVGVLLLFVAPPMPLSGQSGDLSVFSWFARCAPIRITGMQIAQIRGELTRLELPADVRHVIQTKLTEHGLATDDVTVSGLPGAPDEYTVLPQLEVLVTVQPSGRRSISISFEKWLTDPISGEENYATVAHGDVEDRPSRESELDGIEIIIGSFLDRYLEVNAAACDARTSGGRP